MSLPPLKSLPVFEAVARLNSFSKAAEELNVSQSAISHQIRLLEDYLGEALFVRQGRQLSLSSEGKHYLDNVSASLSQIERASNHLKGLQNSHLRIAVYSSFAVYWLIPRLSDLQRRYPHTEVSIEMLNSNPDLSDRVGDCFITVENNKRGFTFEHLYSERLFPVCSPKFYSQIEAELIKVTDDDLETHLKKHPEWITQFPLVTTHSIFNKYAEDWRLWFAAINKKLPGEVKFHNFSHLLLGKEAALHHYGIALINDYMINEDDSIPSLVRLPCHHVNSNCDFYFSYKNSRRHEPEIRAIRSWIKTQSQQLGKP